MSDEALQCLQPVVKQLRKMSTHAPPGGGAPGGWWLKRNWMLHWVTFSPLFGLKFGTFTFKSGFAGHFMILMGSNRVFGA